MPRFAPSWRSSAGKARDGAPSTSHLNGLTVDEVGGRSTPLAHGPFGQPGDADAVGLGFAGREAETGGLLHLRARYLARNCTVRRPDPLGLGGGDPNVHAYVFNDPLNLIDPFGLSALQTA